MDWSYPGTFGVGVLVGIALCIAWKRYVTPWLSKEVSVVITGAETELSALADWIQSHLKARRR